jgi:hypothetical protein
MNDVIKESHEDIRLETYNKEMVRIIRRKKDESS